MENNSVGKKLDWYVSQQIWKIIQYLFLFTYYSISISLRPVLAEDLAVPTTLETKPVQSKPLTYTVVQTEVGESPTSKLGNPTNSVELNAEQQEFNNKTQVVTDRKSVV